MDANGQMTQTDWLFLYEQYKTNPALQKQYPAVWEVAKATHDHYTHQYDGDFYIPSVVVGVVIFAIIYWIVYNKKTTR